MKKLLLIALFVPFQIFAQNITANNLIGDWIKTDVRLKDGSAIYTPSVKTSTIRYIFKPNHTFMMIYNGRTINGAYQLNGNKLSLGNDTSFIIEQLSDIKLVLQEDSTSTSDTPLKVFLEPAKFHNVGFEPESYITKGNDTIYIARRNYLEPFFLNAQQNIMEFVYSNFEYPDYKKGNFSARFIITDKGELKAVKILESSDEKYNDRLIKAIKKSAGKWQAAVWDGKPVNTETQLFFDMTPLPADNGTTTTPKTTEEKVSVSNDYFLAGTDYFEQKKYRQALEYFNKSIELNTFNINAYYNRAATFIMLRQKDAACKDFLTLVQLQQKRGEELYKKYCGGK